MIYNIDCYKIKIYKNILREIVIGFVGKKRVKRGVWNDGKKKEN